MQFPSLYYFFSFHFPSCSLYIFVFEHVYSVLLLLCSAPALSSKMLKLSRRICTTVIYSMRGETQKIIIMANNNNYDSERLKARIIYSRKPGRLYFNHNFYSISKFNRLTFRREAFKLMNVEKWSSFTCRRNPACLD